MFRDLLLLTTIVVYIVDLSGFTDAWHGLLARLLKVRAVRLKPFDCSLCMAWWTGLAYLLITGQVSIQSIALVAGLSFLAYPIGVAMQTIKDGIIKVISIIQNYVE